MWKIQIILIIISILPSLLTAEYSLLCEQPDTFGVCINSTGGLSIYQFLPRAIPLKVNQTGVSSIGSSVFSNLQLSGLTISPDDSANCTPSILDVTPEFFFSLEKVSTIDLTCVEFRGELNNSFSRFESLKTLKLVKNGFTEFPREFLRHLESLKTLTVEQQRIKTVSPAWFDNINEHYLTDLHLDSNGIEDIEPESFSKFQNLQELSLSGNNLEILRPDMFTGCVNPTKIVLRRNRLREIKPETFSQLNGLKVLDLGENNLKTLTDGIFKTSGTNWSLVLDKNPLISLPSDFFERHENLKYLTMGFGEKFQMKPDTFRKAKLWSLKLDSRDLSHLEPGAFSGLSTISINLVYHNDSIIKPNMFQGVTAQLARIFQDNSRQKVDEISWGLRVNTSIRLGPRKKPRSSRNKSRFLPHFLDLH